MPDVKILNENQLRQAVQLDIEAVTCIEKAFELLATKNVSMPPILSLHIPEFNGELDVKTAYVPGINSFAVKMSPGFFDNPKFGLPSLNGLMVLFSAKTGIVENILLDNGYLTDIRTAAAGAVAAKWLSRKNAATAGIIGTGTQARLQLKALTLVRDIKRCVIWGRHHEKAAEFAKDCGKKLGIEIQAADTIQELMNQSDIVVSTTPSQEPLIQASMLKPGQHITAMGSDADYKTELDATVIPAVDLYVCDRLAQCIIQGELRPAIKAGTISPDTKFPELGEIITGQKPGRLSDEQVTICDLTGTGVQDTAIATFARNRTESAGVGTLFTS
ncbi:cyclodeaminase [Sneathiella aquimaris]|uniref:cyclodeaminase n=1 Tax=Sneathiella aquimaris TaxID=2599305 RepID=UPI00146A0767|nr:cyclodeaminase [Sneathiella aquimaris]